MINEAVDMKLKYGKNPKEKVILILERVDLSQFQPQQVLDMFNKSFIYLESIEDYERAAKLKAIEEDYIERLS